MVGQLLLDIDYEISADCETANYLDSSKWGFYSLCSRLKKQDDSGYRGLSQRSYPLPTLPKMLELTSRDRQSDHFVTQAVFSKPNRRKVNLAHMGCAFVDLDYYKQPKLKGKKPEAVLELVLNRCQQWRIPYPSIVVNSGKGLQIKWFHEALPKIALPRWEYLQGWLNDLFHSMGADGGAKDISRILRVVQTVNQKNGHIVRVLWQQSEGYTQEPYSFNELIESVCNAHKSHVRDDYVSPSKTKGRNKKASVSPLKLLSGSYSEDSVNWSRVCDLQKLIELRGGDMGEGLREPMAFYLCNHFALRYSKTLALRPTDEWQEFHQLCKVAAPHWSASHIKEKTRNIYQLTRDDAAGKTVEFNGKQYRPLYTPNNPFLIDLFGITDTEQRQLKTIIGRQEKDRREKVRKSKPEYKEADRKRSKAYQENKRRAAGAKPREAYLEQADDKRQQAIKLRQEGMSLRKIAKQLGVSLGAVQNYLKDETKQGKEFKAFWDEQRPKLLKVIEECEQRQKQAKTA